MDKDMNRNNNSNMKKKRKRKHEDLSRLQTLDDNRKRRKEDDNARIKQVKRLQNIGSKTETGVLNNEKTYRNKKHASLKTGSAKDVKKHKLGTENKLMEKLEELTGKSLRTNSDRQTAEKSETKNSKKKKNVFRMEETVAANDNDDDLDAGLDPEKAALRKKKREKRHQKKLEKKKRKQLAKEKAGTAKVLAIDYLKQWDTDRANWKFQKVRQVFLLQNMFDTSLVNDESFEILLRYLEPLKGNSRETTVKAAEKIIEETENDDSSKDPVKEERARNVIQLFS